VSGAAILDALFGAALVAIGFLAAAVADRIRGLRVTRPSRATRDLEANAVVVPEPERGRGVKSPDSPAPRAKVASSFDALAREVVAVLVAAGYKKSVAESAVWSCPGANTATIEDWTREALRRAAGGAS
jgi:hypothetical protein